MKNILRIVVILFFSISSATLCSEQKKYALKEAIGLAILEQGMCSIGNTFGAMRKMDRGSKEPPGIVQQVEILQKKIEKEITDTPLFERFMGVSTFIATDYAVEQGVHIVDSYEAAQRIKEEISEEHYFFLFNVVKNVIRSAASHATMMIAKSRKINEKNRKKLYFGAFHIIKTEVISNYVTNPLWNALFGPGYSLIIQPAKMVFVFLINRIINKILVAV